MRYRKAHLCLCLRNGCRPFVGKLSYVKVLSGKITADTELLNTRTGVTERPGKLLFIRGKKQEEVKEVTAGDICAISN